LYIAEGNLGKEIIPENNDIKLKVRGSGNGRGGITFSLSKDEMSLAEKIIKIGKELFNDEVGLIAAFLLGVFWEHLFFTD